MCLLDGEWLMGDPVALHTIIDLKTVTQNERKNISTKRSGTD